MQSADSNERRRAQRSEHVFALFESGPAPFSIEDDSLERASTLTTRATIRLDYSSPNQREHIVNNGSRPERDQ